jgi:hypothetical protein
MRYLVTEVLTDFMQLNGIKPSKVAVVGGSSNDPEVFAINQFYPSAQFFYFGIDNSEKDSDFTYIDLNLNTGHLFDQYDLVLCSQVLEHLWDLTNGINNLIKLVSNDGYLWINCPASNMAHGSPEYYSAGYSPEYLKQNLMLRGHEVLMTGCIGSKRQYFMTHILKSWPTSQEHAHPVFGYRFQPGTPQGIVWKFIRELPGRLAACMFSKQIRRDIEYATESYIISKPKES